MLECMLTIVYRDTRARMVWIIKCHLHGFNTKSGLSHRRFRSICKKCNGLGKHRDQFARWIWYLHKFISFEQGQHDASGQHASCKSHRMDKQFHVNHLPMCQLIVFVFALREWFLCTTLYHSALIGLIVSAKRVCLTEHTFTPKETQPMMLIESFCFWRQTVLTSCCLCSFAFNLFYFILFFLLIYLTQRKNDTHHLHRSTDHEIYWLDLANLRWNDWIRMQLHLTYSIVFRITLTSSRQ